EMQELLRESILLVYHVRLWRNTFHDYSFIVFPAAKAYEGFLKTLFYDLGFISKEDFNGKKFRIGRALNPALEPRFRKDESVYDRLVLYCGGNKLPDTLWNAWKHGRNLVFHWFPNSQNILTFAQAKKCIKLIVSAMDKAFEQCRLDLHQNKDKRARLKLA
ncbi:MAG: hypothetical protein NZM26_04480, partial [Patescibacteria group bacterium]|nr:hypothetical protein [Patescibacteria group bacterium]